MEARNLRVSDAEREHVGELLQRAVGQGMLSLGEFTERMDTALAARTRGELNAVLADLPGMTIQPEYLQNEHAALQQQPGGVPAGPYPDASAQPAGTTIRGRMSTISRKGQWQVPPMFAIDTRMSNVSLDFTRAVMTTQVVRIRLDDAFGTLSLVLPPEATADLNGIETTGANVDNKVNTGPPYGPLHIVVTGRTRFGTVTARYPFGTRMRWFMHG
ncbi:DUF1707 domain-containing protein [Rhodococcus sp. HNM0569]|uniref:DUF1707 SHOCT-like domain-containing protein n=1 Tax=Rhodococcus sp. HNM0569 TaxID=2716340 RepID=UPI00146B0872|nr:DUF1707 domain-containing protein [Rhodococcus sp. HNM0569]NLU83713.1 DUF1707 domain-containing protein [Rhodococcus sp. HNM0569]